MARVFDKFDALNSNTTDPRSRRYLTPKRVVLTKGLVTNPEAVLLERTNQITLDAGVRCTLRNVEGQPNAAILVDFGIEFPGSCRLMIWNVLGRNNRADILVRFGESVSEAMTPLFTKNAGNDHAIRDRVMNVGFLSATETNESGYRFAYIELLEPNGLVEFKAIQGVFTYRDLEYKGSFDCSDPMLTRIWDTAAYTAHVNMQEYLWDGIKRDRLVWIGDMHTEINTILAVFGYDDIIAKSLDLVRDETPVGKWMNNISAYTIWWLLMHCDLYRTVGNLEYLKEQRDYLCGIMEIFCGLVDEDGAEKLPEIRLLDWPNHDNPKAEHAGFQGLLKMALDHGAYLLNILGETALAEKCLTVAERMKNHIPDPDGSKPAAAMLVLSGLADAKEINDTVIAPRGAHGFSTFFSYYILKAKAMAGDMEGALNDMKTYFGGMLSVGATTFWEDFNIDWLENAAPLTEPVPEGKKDIHGDFGGYCYVNFRHSLCHGWASGPCPFLSHFVLGVQALSPDTYEVKPDLAYLDWARGTYPTPCGIIEVDARKVDGELVIDVKAPEGIRIVR